MKKNSHKIATLTILSAAMLLALNISSAQAPALMTPPLAPGASSSAMPGLAPGLAVGLATPVVTSTITTTSSRQVPGSILPISATSVAAGVSTGNISATNSVPVSNSVAVSNSVPVVTTNTANVNTANSGSKTTVTVTSGSITPASNSSAIIVESKSENKNESKLTNTAISGIMSNTSNVDLTLKQMGEAKARLDQIKLLQELKEAEYKLSQPVEDKTKKDGATGAGGLSSQGGIAGMGGTSGVASPTGNIAAANFNPVIKNKGAPSSVPQGEAEAFEVSAPKAIVYSVIGFEGDYSAKISLDGRSVYTVRKNDILPDGQLVLEVTKYYIVLAGRNVVAGKVSDPQRIYVTGKPAEVEEKIGGTGKNITGNSLGNVASPGGAPRSSGSQIGMGVAR